MNKPISDPRQSEERTSFQEIRAYDPRVDIKSDVVMVYGIGPELPAKIETWRKEGYRIHVMTGVAWGDYQDFLFGKYDGENHEDAGQRDRDGKQIDHGPTVPYMCPTETYGKYLCVGVKRAIDAGAEAIHLEEPEFWVRGGYEEAFKREWQAYYNEPWIPPHASPDAQYRASKLKYYLYRRALKDVFAFVRDYSHKIGREVKCYVPTHSMINYAWWRIVSPESSLVQIDGCDGYIGQVWTGTSRTPNTYKGVTKERTFESAFCEYGVLQNLVRSTGKRMWYLNDPVEDNGSFCWADYRMNWESTLVASLLWPEVSRYEVAPWPSRVFTGKFPRKNLRDAAPGEEVTREPIPADYATELLTVFNEMNNLKQDKIAWECGTPGIGILVSDTMMFQRGDPEPGDPHFGSFFGLALPLIKCGSPVEPVQFENATIPGYLDPYKVLFLTYEGMKPPKPELHDALAKWIKAGGVLVFVDNDSDLYLAVHEWWNTKPMDYLTPRTHLFEKLGVAPGSDGVTAQVGKGALIYAAASPKSLTKDADGAHLTVSLAKQACKLAGVKWSESSSILLRRGPYVIAAGLDEAEGLPVRTIEGEFLDMFSPKLEVRRKVALGPSARVFLLDLAKANRRKPTVLASASKILGVEATADGIRFHSEGPGSTTCATRVALPKPPVSFSAEDAEATCEWDAESRTALMTYPNSPRGRWVEVAVG